MTQFADDVKGMMTNALPGIAPQMIGFLLHQNQRYIDHDKPLDKPMWPGHLFIKDTELRTKMLLKRMILYFILMEILQIFLE